MYITYYPHIIILCIYHHSTYISSYYVHIIALCTYNRIMHISSHYPHIIILCIYHHIMYISLHYVHIIALRTYHHIMYISSHYFQKPVCFFVVLRKTQRLSFTPLILFVAYFNTGTQKNIWSAWYVMLPTKKHTT